MYIIVLVALSYEELLLHPVGKLQETWVNEILDVLHIFFGDAHSAQLHAAVGHLVYHVDVE